MSDIRHAHNFQDAEVEAEIDESQDFDPIMAIVGIVAALLIATVVTLIGSQ